MPGRTRTGQAFESAWAFAAPRTGKSGKPINLNDKNWSLHDSQHLRNGLEQKRVEVLDDVKQIRFRWTDLGDEFVDEVGSSVVNLGVNAVEWNGAIAQAEASWRITMHRGTCMLTTASSPNCNL